MSTFKVQIPLIPSDFSDKQEFSSQKCALANAIRRLYPKTTGKITVGTTDILEERFPYSDQIAEIHKYFLREDYEYVKEQYKKDPQMKKTQYVVTLFIKEQYKDLFDPNK